MDNLRFINLTTFEITEIPENYIYADKDIVETIAILNQKGYKTTASCSGHPDVDMLQQVDKKENLKKYYYTIPTNLKDTKWLKDEEIMFQYANPITDTYIMFDKEYQFSDLPKGFKKNNCIIRKETDIFDENKKAYEYMELQEKIKKTNEELLEWAKELKEYKG